MLQTWADCSRLLDGGLEDGMNVTGAPKGSWAHPFKYDKVAITTPPNVLSIWTPSVGEFENVPLQDCDSPVGATYLGGKIYVACFGVWPVPKGTSGLAVVNEADMQFEGFYAYPNDITHIHNVYVFDWNGRKEIFVAVMGNVWLELNCCDIPKLNLENLAGEGIVMFNRDTTSYAASSLQLNARSAVQDADGVFYILTQEPQGKPSKLARVEKQGDILVQRTVIALPDRPNNNSADGGADVFLGQESGSVWCTDRTDGGGKLYYYTYEDGVFAKVNEFSTGVHPRHTTISASGDIVACNRIDRSMSIFKGLARNPKSQDIEVHTKHGLPFEPMFFMDGLPSSQE
jgi:hypothetical protein